MLGTLPTPILLDIAILLTALCWSLGFFIADRKIHLFASLAIGCFVCLFGYSVESLGAPTWAVVAAPVPLDILLLWYILRKPREMADCIRFYLGDLRRAPYPDEFLATLRLTDSRMASVPIMLQLVSVRESVGWFSNHGRLSTKPSTGRILLSGVHTTFDIRRT